MIPKKDYPQIQSALQAALQESFAEVAVQVGDDIHYPGTNVVITSPDFAGLYPEQRFHHVVRVLPAELYETLRGNVVWFELAPGESAIHYMKMPRSEDIVGQEMGILKRLTEVKFFKQFEAKLMAKRQAPSPLDFIMAKQILADAGLSPEEIKRACLFFIRHGGYSDVQVFSNVMEELAGSHTDESQPRGGKTARSAQAKKTPGVRQSGAR